MHPHETLPALGALLLPLLLQGWQRPPSPGSTVLAHDCVALRHGDTLEHPSVSLLLCCCSATGSSSSIAHAAAPARIAETTATAGCTEHKGEGCRGTGR